MIVSQQPLIPGVSPLKKPLPVFNEPVRQISALLSHKSAVNQAHECHECGTESKDCPLPERTDAFQLNEEAGTRHRASAALLAERGHYCRGGRV